MIRAICLVLALAATPAWAERHADCPNERRLSGVPEDVGPNIRTRFIAPPRLVGGEVTCLLVAVEGGYSRFIEEVLPGQAGRFAMIHGHLGVTLSDRNGSGDGRDVAECVHSADDSLTCWVDLSQSGGGLRLTYGLASDGALQVQDLRRNPAFLADADLDLIVPGQGAMLRLERGMAPGAADLRAFEAALAEGRHGLDILARAGAGGLRITAEDLQRDLALARRFFSILLPEILPR
ncbi:hypothetical protein V8J82_15755 [Gymnodinialimonas sp. 2305UL16-5]|uniref:hypothetical protein n=1 Tax=Gymnodinialimonas mytili TaxID=3126503 RepID=UPI0030ADED2A